MYHRIKTLMIKELLTVWRDKKSRFYLIVPPILQLFIFAFAATLDVKNVPIALLNRDAGKASFELIQRFRGSPTFAKNFAIDSEKDIADVIDRQKAVMVIQIDDEFSRNVEEKKPAIIQLILDGRKSNTAQIVLGYASRIIERFAQEYPTGNPPDILPTVLVPRNWFNPNLLYYWFNVPNLCGVLTMLVSIIITSLSVARERELGTFDQLLVSPLHPIEIVCGKALPALVISFVEATIIITIAIFFFQIPFTGSLLLLYGSLFVFISSVVGIGLFLSSLAQTQQQAVLGTFLFLSPAILLSGYATPIENMPPWLQTLNLANPLRYFLIIVKGIFLKTMPAHIVFSNVWPMAIIALCTFSFATWFFRKRLE